MKEQIERRLQQLIGLQLTATTRAANMECLKFGHLLETNKSGKQIQIGEFALHLQCPWRFTNEAKILIGSLDLYEPVDENAEYDEHFDWDRPNENLRDFKLLELITTQDLTTVSVVADSFGGLEISFINSIRLSIFPAYSKVDQYSEHWRLLTNKATNKNHFVVGGFGVLQDLNGL